MRGAGGKWPSHPNLHFGSYEDGRDSEENKCGPSSFFSGGYPDGCGCRGKWPSHPNLHFESYADGRASEENKCGPSSFFTGGYPDGRGVPRSGGPRLAPTEAKRRPGESGRTILTCLLVTNCVFTLSFSHLLGYNVMSCKQHKTELL